jgi:hypothetical protein
VSLGKYEDIVSGALPDLEEAAWVMNEKGMTVLKLGTVSTYTLLHSYHILSYEIGQPDEVGVWGQVQAIFNVWLEFPSTGICGLPL